MIEIPAGVAIAFCFMMLGVFMVGVYWYKHDEDEAGALGGTLLLVTVPYLLWKLFVVLVHAAL